jgi:hypothetical protein
VPRSTRDERIAAAIHEAGHVVARATGRRVSWVSNVPDERSHGQVVFETLPVRGRQDRALTDREVAIALAGDLAARRYRGSPSRKPPSPRVAPRQRR